MKMRSVIEAGRKASPLVNSGIESLGRSLDSIIVMLEDMSNVNSDLSMGAISAECAKEADLMKKEFMELKGFWEDFSSTLAAYKYRTRKCKRAATADLPGQMVLSEEFLQEQEPDLGQAGSTPA